MQIQGLSICTKNGQSLQAALEGGPMLMPIREITASNFGIKASFPSDKNPTMLQAESLLEYDFLTLLEWDPTVLQYGTQPLTITWVDDRGRKRKYTPDVLVSYLPEMCTHNTMLRATVYEVKTQAELRRDWAKLKPKFVAATAALRLAGIRFKIVTEKHIRTPRLDNARFLLSYKTSRFVQTSDRETQMIKDLRHAAFTLGQTTPKGLLAQVATTDEQKILYIPWMWWLVAVGLLQCDMDQRLTMVSPIKSTDTLKSLPE